MRIKEQACVCFIKFIQWYHREGVKSSYWQTNTDYESILVSSVNKPHLIK